MGYTQNDTQRQQDYKDHQDGAHKRGTQDIRHKQGIRATRMYNQLKSLVKSSLQPQEQEVAPNAMVFYTP